jgi:DNA-binding transcriptional regulator LsrR (DeoR family)
MITFELPNDLEHALRQQIADLDQAAKEAALVELYRQDRLTQAELARALGCSRFDVEALLKRHRVTEDLITADELRAELHDRT